MAANLQNAQGESPFFVMRRFDESAMRSHSHLLGVASGDLNHAYQAAMAIGCISEMLRGNVISQDFEDGVFTSYQADQLISAVGLLARNLSESLCKSADWFDKNLVTSEGGAQ